MQKLTCFLLFVCLTSCDVTTFNPSYSKKDNKVYWNTGLQWATRSVGSPKLTEITIADYESFEDLGGFYAIDKNHVYYEGGILEGVDLKSFEVFQNTKGKEHYLAQDRFHIYKYGRKICNIQP